MSILYLILLWSNCVYAADDWKLVWSDEFNGNAINTKDWKFDRDCLGGGNNELQCYTNRKENAYIKDGHLVIHAIPETYDNHQYTSARLHLLRSGWTYGKFESRARMPKGKHLWPAIWLYPQDSVYGTWAASGEVDIMEYRGQKPSENQGTIHFGGYWPHNAYSGSREKDFGVDFSADFHTFTLEWDQNAMKWFVDGKQYHEENMKRSFWSKNGPNPYTKDGQPFDVNFQWILNMAIGGGFFPAEKYGSLSVEDAKKWPKPTFEIDYVRVYQKPGQIHGNGNGNESTMTLPTESPNHTTDTTEKERTTVTTMKPGSLLDANGCCPTFNGKICHFDHGHHCVKDDGGKILLCAESDAGCNGQCYSVELYKCVDGKLQHK